MTEDGFHKVYTLYLTVHIPNTHPEPKLTYLHRRNPLPIACFSSSRVRGATYRNRFIMAQ